MGFGVDHSQCFSLHCLSDCQVFLAFLSIHKCDNWQAPLGFAQRLFRVFIYGHALLSAHCENPSMFVHDVARMFLGQRTVTPKGTSEPIDHHGQLLSTRNVLPWVPRATCQVLIFGKVDGCKTQGGNVKAKRLHSNDVASCWLPFQAVLTCPGTVCRHVPGSARVEHLPASALFSFW